MNSLIKSLIIFLFATAPTLFCFAQNSNSKTIRITSLEQKIPEILDSAGIPGISVALINDNKIVWSKGFGVSNRETGTKVTERTIFPAASLGKPVFAYAVLKMADEGKLHLDSAIISTVPLDYLENKFFKGKMIDENIKLITPRMILSHSSGLPNWRNSDEQIKTFFKPGTKYSYSGEGYLFLQLTVEYILKKPIEKVMQDYVFKPLSMDNSTYLLKDTVRLSMTYGNDGKAVSIKNDVSANVAHTFKTNATDYARFILAILNGKGLSRNIFKDMFTPQITTDICGAGKVSWGLGFAIQHTLQGASFYQWGKSPNASAYVIGFNASKKAIVYFTNIANQGLRIGEKMVQETLNYQDPLFACFGVKQYNQ